MVDDSLGDGQCHGEYIHGDGGDDDGDHLGYTTVLKYPPEIKKVLDDMIIFSKITV